MNKELLRSYLELKKQEEIIKSQKEILAKQIKEELAGIEGGKYIDEEFKASLVGKTTYKYKDEFAILDYLKRNKLHNFFQEKVNTTELNKELKKEGLVANDLKDYYIKENSDSLTVSEV